MAVAGKKLLVLDINGLLIDTYFQAEQRPDRPHDAKVNRFYVYKRNGCEDFVQFCLQNFIVGVWSSAREHNVVSLVEFMFKESKDKLAFIWHQMHCTDTRLKHPENKHKPVFLKELSKLWHKSEPDLPWEKGEFGPSNTVLIDDSPYKALKNPPHTGIFPETYKATDSEDNYLVGELGKYLEGLVGAANVQVYIEKNPFGVPRLAHGDQHYHFFSSVVDATEIPALPGQPPASPKQEARVVAVANTAGDTVVALPDADVFATSRRNRGRFGSTAEESLDYCAIQRVQSALDFAERLSGAVEASQNVACGALGGADPPVADGTLGKPPGLGASQKSGPGGTSRKKDKDRSRSRKTGRREGQFTVSQRRDHAHDRHAQQNPHSGRGTSVISVEGQKRRGGYESQQKFSHKSVSGNHQWTSPGLDPHEQYRVHVDASDTAVPYRLGGSRDWQAREHGWDAPAISTRQRANADHPGRLTGKRTWHSPVPPYMDSRARVPVEATSPSEVSRRRVWSRDSRPLNRGLLPYKGRPRDREALLKDKIVDKGRPRDREFLYKETVRDPEFPLRAGPRAFDNAYNLVSGEHEVTHRAGAREHEDINRSYSRSSFSHNGGFTRGRPREFTDDKNPQTPDPERVRGRYRHHEDVDRGYKRPIHIHDTRVEGVSANVPYSEYDTYRQSDNLLQAYDERNEDNYGKSRSRSWRETEKGQSGPSESLVRREDGIAGRIGRMSSRHYEQAHSRGTLRNKWER